ncbi:MAG TPA: PAS domain S-box protein, partial [Cryomorphaceae bacterium]|nr:PAS domain S-box protein [Cryomorphaceae bacterium]
MSKSKTEPVPIVGIGASAGGLNEFECFFKNLPKGLGTAYVVIQHLDPDHESILAEIIGRSTNMEVAQIKDNEQVKPDRCYVIPPGSSVTYREDGSLQLTNMERRRGRLMPIDYFFKSLGPLKNRAVAIVLSGTGSDGSSGIRTVKESGGLILVQAPESSQYDGMPLSALKTGVVDQVMKVEEMPELIRHYFENGFDSHQPLTFELKEIEKSLPDILDSIELRTGQSFRDYKRNSVLRRIQRRVVTNKMSDVREYLSLLKDSADEQDALYKDLLISVTGFFRDKEVWEYIRSETLPQLFKNRPDELRIWVPGCATGEEAYTWALICMDYINRNELSVTLRIFASDIDGDAIRRGREGIYTASVAQDIPDNLLKTYFVSENGRYRIKKSIRQSVIFAEQNFVQNPPYSNLDVISCRNVMIYMDVVLQEKALTIFHYSLRNKGVLLLGKAETLGNKSKYYKTEDRLKKVYRKLNSLTDPSKFWQLADGFSGRVTSPPRKVKEEDKPLSVLAEQYVLSKHVPPSLVVNERGEILYVQGRTGKYLEISTGEISTNITKVAKSGLRLPIATALRKAHKTGREIIHKEIALTGDDEDESENGLLVDLSVGPLKQSEPEVHLYMVILKPSHSKTATRIRFDKETDGEEVLEELKRELDEKEEYLQKTIEDLESTNEELKSSNEEAQSANEELQSTNEELETSKEELQSINEELTSTNDELNAKVAELDDSNSKLNNLLRSTEIATVFLDREMKIFEFTPALSQIMELRESDKGRSIQQFAHSLTYDDLVDDAKRVLKTLVPEETEVQSFDGRSFWMRIVPYRTMDDTIEGVVLTFTDFTEKKKQEKELERHRNHLQELLEEKNLELVESEKKYRNIAENLPGLVMKYCVNPNGEEEIVFISQGAHDLYGVSPQAAMANAETLWERVHPDDLESLKRTIDESAKDLSLWDIEHRIVLPDGKTRWVQARGVPVRAKDGSTVWDTVKIDITERKEAMHNLQAKDVLIHAITDNIPGYVVRYLYHSDGSEEILYISKGIERILGITVEEAKKDVGLLWKQIHGEDLESLRKAYSEVDSDSGTISLELRIKDRHNELRWLRCFSKYSVDENGSITWDVLNLDITDSKQSELALLREEKKYSDLIHSLNEGIWQVDAEGQSVFLNDKMAEMLGYTREEMMGKSLLNFLDKKGQREFNKHRKRLEKGITETYDVNFISKSGDRIHTRISTSGIFDENGEFTGAIAGVIDITNKVKTQSELKKSEEQYKIIFENSLTPILVCNNEGQIVSFNKAALNFFEHSEKELEDKMMQDFHFQRPLSDDRADGSGVLFNFAKKEQGELKFTSDKGIKKHALYHAFRIRKDFNLSVFTDITNLKMTQDALKESERLLNETSEVARVGGWSYNVEKNELTWTKEMYDLYEVPVNFEPTIEKVFDYYHPAYRSIVEDLWSESLRIGKSFNVELKIKTHKGNELSVRSIFKPKSDENGNVAFIYGNTQDITDLIKARKDIIGAKQKAEEANKAKSEFLAHMSHEIRTPLNGVIGFGDLLRRTELDNTQQEYVDLVNKSARNLMEIINNILDFSKIEAGKVELEYIETNLFYILEKSVDIVSYPAGDKQLELLLKIDPALPQIVEVDRVRLKQILANLLSNAVKFTDQGEVILEVTSEDVGNSECAITFSVRDTGIGLSKEAQKKLFKAFSQADSATTRKY